MKKLFFQHLACLGCLCLTQPVMAQQVTLNIDAGQRGAAIGDRHYGIFWEEINHAGDGGLYAELIHNRSFEDNAANPDRWHSFNNATLSLVTDNLLNNAQSRALKVTINTIGSGVRNEGYWGIHVVKGRTYKLSFWARSQKAMQPTLTAQLQTQNGSVLGTTSFKAQLGTEWTKYTAEITATGADNAGWFALKSNKTGTFYLDVVSLFPPTYKDRENGCRIDLAEMLKAMNPSFVRFPGGCYVEGNFGHNKTNRFEWKNTIGPIEERPGHLNNNWGYNITDGFGFHEMLQLTEDLGAEPLFVVNMGMGHGWVIDYNQIDEYIQEALDAIEYCNGDTNTTWGALRAKNGHPEPFGLRLIEIGNENYNFNANNNSDQSDHYAERYIQFYNAIRAKYPDVTIIGNVESWGTDAPTWRNPHPVDVVDEHYYRSPSWFISQYHKYDTYSRAAHKIYVGEYAVTQDYGINGHLNAAIGEAVFMQGMENNSDVCIMNSYAPIFVNENNYNWRPDMIRFNSYTSYGTPSYYVQQLFPNHIGKVNTRWTEENNSLAKETSHFGLSTWNTTASFDNLRVSNAEGTTIFEDDFSEQKDVWTAAGGSWNTTDGVLQQEDASMTGQFYMCNVSTSANYTFEIDATKNSGKEGFLIAFKYDDSDNYCWWNLGGWDNTRHAVELSTNGVKSTVASKDGSLRTGHTYHIRIEVNDTQVRCFLDDEEIHNFTLPHGRKIYVSSSIDDEKGKMFVKLVNPYASDVATRINLSHATTTGGKAIVLTSEKGTDENSLSNPNNVVPKEHALDVSGTSFTYDVPAYSVNILCLDVTNITLEEEVKEELPQPVVSYDFSTGKAEDGSGTYPGTLHGNAIITKMNDGNQVLYSGDISGKGYMDLGTEMPKEILKNLDNGYSVSIDLLLNNVGQLTNYCWAYGIANGTNQFLGIVNSPNNTRWYYTIKDHTTTHNSFLQSGLSYKKWHNLTYIYNGTTAYLYVDGYLSSQESCPATPSTFVEEITEAYIARSPFTADAIMTNTFFDNFCIYNTPLTENQVKQLYDRTKTMATRSSQVEDTSALLELNTFMSKFQFIHTSTDLPQKTEYDTPIRWTFQEEKEGYVSLADGKLNILKFAEGTEPVTAGILTAEIVHDEGSSKTSVTVRVAPDDQRYGYLYCFMNSDKEITNYALGFKEDKGKKFHVLLNGDEIFNTKELASIEGGTRDAYLNRGEEKDGFFLTTTDMCVANSNIWNNYGMNLMHSKDLIHWESTTFDFRKGKSVFSDPEATTGCYDTDEAYAKINRVWAPQWIWDPDYNNGEGAYLVYYSLLSSNPGDSYDRIYYSYTDREFKTLTQPRLFFDPGMSVIDADIVWNPYDQLYHMYYKREAAGGYDRGIYEATSQTLLGNNWKDIMHVTNEGTAQVEGSSVLRRINEDIYNLYYMRYSNGYEYKFCETNHLGLSPTSSSRLNGNGAFQHGSFMTVTEEEYKMLQSWSDVALLLKDIVSLNEEQSSVILSEAIAKAERDLSITDIHELYEQLPITYEQLIDAQKKHLEEKTGSLEDGDILDMTFLLTNPQFDEGFIGWEGTELTNVSHSCGEQWNKTFNTYQMVLNVPNGTYRVSVQGFYREGTFESAATKHLNNTESLNALLYANEESKPLVSIFSESGIRNGVNTAAGIVPDNMEQASIAFRSGLYANELTLDVTDNLLRIGIRKETHVNSDWTIFDNFRLEYIGKTKEDGITNPNQTFEPSDIYSIDGRIVRRAGTTNGLKKGIYIQDRKKFTVF